MMVLSLNAEELSKGRFTVTRTILTQQIQSRPSSR